MSLIVTPKQIGLRGEFYYQAGALLAAGLPLPKALESLHRKAVSRSFRRPLAIIIQALEQGSTLTEAMLQTGRWMPSFDIALLEAGEKSGRLDECFKLLGSYYSERAQLTRQVMGGLAYPVFLVHFAVFITPFPQLFLTGDIQSYLKQVLGALLPLYVVVFFLLWLFQSKHGERWRALVERLCRLIPLLGSARRSLALARLSVALESLINAGVSIINAWELAAVASGSPALRRTVFAWRQRVEDGGEQPSEVVSESSEFPELFANLYHSGEVSGQLDTTLHRLYEHYREEGSRKLKLLAEWFPRLVYIAIALTIAARVVNFWSGYYANIMKVLE